MAKCLVIGGNGFVGSHLVEALLDAGHEVTVFDRFSRPPRFDAARVRLITGDFLNVADVRGALDGQQIVYHMLSLTTPATAEADPLMDVRTNITGSIELFRAAADLGVEHVYFASTGGAIYGDGADGLTREDASTLPVSPYAIGKLAIERYLEYFRVTRGLSSTSLRISNPYGPGQNPAHRQGVIPIFLRAVAAGAPLTVFGDGSMSRDFIYVADVARRLVPMIGRPHRHAVYNIGSGVSATVSDVIGMITEVTGREPIIEHRPTPPTFVDHIALDTQRYEADFGTPEHSLDLREGITRTWRDIVENE